jgi:hypothetical protein
MLNNLHKNCWIILDLILDFDQLYMFVNSKVKNDHNSLWKKEIKRKKKLVNTTPNGHHGAQCTMQYL